MNIAATPVQSLSTIPVEQVIILFGAEQGFAGAFTNRILDAAGRAMVARRDQAHIMMIGTRGIGIAAERGLKPTWMTAMANQIGNVTEVANRIAEALYARIAKRAISKVDMFYRYTDEGRALQVRHTRLLPIAFETFRMTVAAEPPFTTLDPTLLLTRLAEEYIYARLCEAAMHSFAAENEVRMQAMSAASDNINKALDKLMQRARHVRQEEVTAEIVELAAGVQAQNDQRR